MKLFRQKKTKGSHPEHRALPYPPFTHEYREGVVIMTMFEYAIASFKSMKGKSPKEKWTYFLDYFAIPTAVVIVVLVSIISWRISVANRKDVILEGILVNSGFSEEQSSYTQGFYEYAGVNTDENEAKFTTNISFTNTLPQMYAANLQTLYTKVGVGEVDFITGQAQIFPLFAYNRSHMLRDLREVLPEELLSQLEGRLYYIDRSILEQEEDYSDLTTPSDSSEEQTFNYPDPSKQEEMVDPIPIGIDIRDCQQFRDAYYPESETLYLGIATNYPNPEMLLTFLQYLLFENG